MKATLRYLLLLIFWLTLQQSYGQIVNGKGTAETETQTATVTGQVLTFTDALSTQIEKFEAIVTGSPATLTITIQGLMSGGTNCGNALVSAATTNQVLILPGPCSKWQITTAFTGGTAPTVAYNRLATVSPQQPPTTSVSALSASTNQLATLAEKGPRWIVNNSPATGSQAVATKAAGGAGVRHVVDCIGFAMAATTAPAATLTAVILQDNGSTIMAFTVVSAASVGQLIGPTTVCGLNLMSAAANTPMLLAFGASVANTNESVWLSGYDVQ